MQSQGQAHYRLPGMGNGSVVIYLKPQEYHILLQLLFF